MSQPSSSTPDTAPGSERIRLALDSVPAEIQAVLHCHRQSHLVGFWNLLAPAEREHLYRQISEIDFDLVSSLTRHRNNAADIGVDRGADRAAIADSPGQMVRLAGTDAERQRDRRAEQVGHELLRQGKVGALLVAGGQGSRLGFDDPKGMYPIGPVSRRSLYQILCERLLARSIQSGTAIPYFIMTSEATHAATVSFFRQNHYFGLNREDVYFFQQASLPAVHESSPRLLLEKPHRVATSPDGHGGVLRALKRHGLMQVMRTRGIEHLYYHQVDNPTAETCCPRLLGHHLLADSDMTTVAVAKVSPEERMGVLADVGGRTEIIEYSDLPLTHARRQRPDGSLVFWAGNTAIHVFRRDFLERLIADELSLPFHVAHKKVEHLDDAGRLVSPEAPNAHKFEQFIFDALPHARRALVVEGDRTRSFHPVKNAAGSDSPETCRQALSRMARQAIEQAGGGVAPGVIVEISPLALADRDKFREKVAGRLFDRDTVIE